MTPNRFCHHTLNSDYESNGKILFSKNLIIRTLVILKIIMCFYIENISEGFLFRICRNQASKPIIANYYRRHYLFLAKHF